MAAEDAGTWPAERVVTLPEAIAADGDWVRPSGVSVFKSVGTAVQDLAAARAVAREALAHGVGREVDLLTPKMF